MTMTAIIELVAKLAALGASPAVQQAAIEHLGHVHGHSQADIHAAVLEQKTVWQPKQGAR